MRLDKIGPQGRMQSQETRSSELLRRQLEKILASAGFARNDRLSGFLRFVVEQELSGCGDQLKESTIGVEVFGRRPDYDVRRDPVVRTDAGKLRARLAEYYATEGASDPLVIQVPKGGYRPVFSAVAGGGSPAPLGPTRPRTRVWVAVALGCLAVALAAFVWWRSEFQRAPIPIAVLPLINLSQDPANDYFADGLTEEVIRNLSIIEGLAVRSQTSSFAFKGKQRNVQEAGKQLGADYILEGAVLRSGQQLRINAQLVRVHDDFPLWSARYDRELTDILAIQDEISRGIVNSLRLKLGRGRRRYETSVEAYDFYLRARALETLPGASGVTRSRVPFGQAIAKDPSFAPAYAGLAVAHVTRSGYFIPNVTDETVQARAAAEKAIQLDPLLADAHDALGMVHARDAQWPESEKEFRRAIELDPGASLSRIHFAAFLLWPLGRMEEALHQLRLAERSDPLSAAVQFALANVLISAGRFNDADAHSRQLPQDSPNTHLTLARIRLGQRRVSEAIEILEEDVRLGRLSNDGLENWGALGYAYARAGRREEAEKLEARLSPNQFNNAMIFAGLGDKDRTLEALDRATRAGPFRIGRALTFPEFAFIRGDPRVKTLRKKVGLPE